MTLPSLIESGIAEFERFYGKKWKEACEDWGNPPKVEFKRSLLPFLTSFATNVHNTAIESALEALPKDVMGIIERAVKENQMINPNWVQTVLEMQRAKLSALKKENV